LYSRLDLTRYIAKVPSVKLFPTFVQHGYTHINLPNPNATARAEFFNTLGQSIAVFDNVTQYQRIDIQNFSRGIYMVWLKDSDGNKVMIKIEKW
jgi:hypothetical protein